MMNINSRAWVLLFVFYGVIFFFMGFCGYRLKTDGSQRATRTQPLVTHGKAGIQRNLMAESEEYLVKLLARYNWLKTDTGGPEPGKANDTGKLNGDIPVWASSKQARLVFCFPEDEYSGILEPVISRFGGSLKTSLAGVKEIPLNDNRHWDAKLAEILTREQPAILIGINETHPGPDNSLNFNKDKILKDKILIQVDFYIAMEERWRSVLLPRIITGLSSNLSTFNLDRKKQGDLEMITIIWAAENESDLTGLAQNMESVIKILQEVPELRTVKNI